MVGGGWRTVRRGPLSLALAGLLLIAVACGGSDEPTTKDQPPQAATAQAAAAASASTPATQSRAFTDDTGKTFTVEQPPKRVVALSPSVVEIMYAVGVPPVARPSSANYPEAAKSLPAVGTSYTPNLEAIAAQTPDFIIADAQLQSPQTVAEIAKIGAPVFTIRVQSVADVSKALRTVGALLGKAEEGEKVAKEIEAKLQSVQAKLPPENERPSVFVLIGDANAFFGAKPDSFAGDVVAKMGARNVVPAGPDSAGAPGGFTGFSLEQLVALDPDVILVVTVGRPGAPPTSQQLAGNPAWSGLRAVKNGRVKEAPVEELVQAAGPRITNVIDLLGPVLYPGRF